MNLRQLQQELTPLEDQGASAALLSRGRQCLPQVQAGTPEEAYLQYLIGKGLVGLEDYTAALPPLQRALQLEPARAHAHYLLGYCLARQAQWPAALAAQERSCGLDPHLADSWYEQGRAALELGLDQRAAAAVEKAVALRPSWEAAQALLHAARVRVALPLGLEPAAQAIRAARDAAPLPVWLLRQWCELAGATLLAGRLPEARLLLEALAWRAPHLADCAHPLPRRLALLLLAVIELLEPGAPERAVQLAAELRDAHWLPACPSERALWPSLLEPAIELLLVRAGPQLKPAALGRQLLISLPRLEPPLTDTSALHRALAERLPAVAAPAPLAGGLGVDPLQLSALSDGLGQLRRRLRQVADLGEERHRLDRQLLALDRLLQERPAALVRLPGQEDAALALRRQALAALVPAASAMVELDGMAPLPRRRGPRWRWLLVASPGLPQCVLYRVEQKRQQLERLGCSVQLLWCASLDTWSCTTQLLEADAVLICRLEASYPLLRWIASARRFGLPVYYDIDDLLFDPQHCPPAFSSYGGTLSPALHRRFRLDVCLYSEAIEACDGLIVSTDTLAARWRELRPDWQRPLWVLPNLAPPELLQLARPPRPPQGGPLQIVFASGTTAHKQAWQQELAPALAQLLERNPQLYLLLLGHVPLPPVLLPHAARVRCRPFSSYRAYLAQLAEADLGVVVLEPGVFTDAKSAIRWMEFSLLGLASVLSPTATYRQLLEPGRDALFARGTPQWIDSLQQLIDQPGQRQALAARAHTRALQQFAPGQADAFWSALIGADPAPAPAPARRRRRLLVIHAFFAPQSVGGATRVVQDQVRQLLQHAADAYEITVLCADLSPWQGENMEASEPPLLAVDSHAWHGARVVRLALPRRPWARHRDPAVAEFCRRWFAAEGFDLIHAHCLQLLTAAPLQVAAELGIPTVVTLHDGWWLSPQLFLTSVSGRPVDPADPLAHHDDPASQSPKRQRADRRRRADLMQVLAAAKARLAVSAAFADVYRRGGVADVGVLENDWQPMPRPLPRRVRPADQPLRLCFVGGRSFHKGYAVLQAALLRTPLQRAGAGATLTVIDADLTADERSELRWNDTPVRFVPAVAMAEMAGFYAEHDVLIAPSIWPESYGLVTREALSAGLWVLASAIGALADPIDPGVNGHRLPPGDPHALGQALLSLCERHPTPPPPLAAAPRAIEVLLPLYASLLS